MNIARPWDCEAFPKSKTICYGGGGGGGGDPITNVVDTVQEKVIDPVVETYEGSDLQTLVETPGEAVQTALGISDEDVEAVSDAVSVDVGNVGTGLEFSVPTIGTPEFAASNMDWGAFAPSTPFVNPFASVDIPTIKMPTALDQTSFDNSIVDDATNVISDTVDDLTPNSFQDLSNQISDNTQDLKITDTSTQDIVNTVSDVIPDVKIIPEDLTSVLPGADDVQSVTALTEGIHKKVDLISNTVSQVTPDIKIIPEDLSDSISDVTPDFKNTTTSTQDLVEQIPTVPEILTKVDETGDAAATFVKGGVQAAADAGTAIAKPFVDAYTGSDLDTVLQQAEDRAKLLLGYKGGTTSPDPTGAVQNTINTNPLQDITDAFGNIVESLVNVPVRTSAQPTVAAGDVPGGPIASPEEPIVGITQRNRQMMSGRRKTMLTVGQSAAKIRARQTGY